MSAKRLSISTYIAGINNGDRLILSRAITLVESSLPSDRQLAREVLNALNPSKKSIRIGITGVPGVGKSTFIEAFGSLLIERNNRVAVLSVDPSSQRTKGSILGDKTRMEHLSYNPMAFIRPSPAGSTTGGVTDSTAESILLCEAAGYDIIIVETVGVGQSETSVKDITDFMLLLMLPGAGDELQGIKRGIMELADAIVINKADENLLQAKQAATNYRNALHLFPPAASGWVVPVLLCSSVKNTGIAEVWENILTYKNQLQASGDWQKQRETQRVQWLHRFIQREILRDFYQNNNVAAAIPNIESAIISGKMHPVTAAERLLSMLKES